MNATSLRGIQNASIQMDATAWTDSHTKLRQITMRDIDRMIAVLRKGAEDPNGRILAPLTMGSAGTHHQVELLA